MKKRLLLLILIIAASVFTYSCSFGDDVNEEIEDQIRSSSNIVYSFVFTDSDMDTSYDEEEAVIITLDDEEIDINGRGATSENDVLKITEDGTYIISGVLNDGQILVDTDKESKIRIVLNGVSINNDDGSAIYVKQAAKVFLTMVEGSENSFSTTGEIKNIDENNIDAVIFSNDNLTINGEGCVTVSTDYGNGITSKDDLVFTGGTYKINVSGKALEAKDRVKIADGEYYLIAGDDGIHCENDEEKEGTGYVYINDGNFTIFSGDDGIHGNSNVTINGGNIVIEEAYEGIEAQTVDINGGIIYIYTADDGINAAGGNDGSSFHGLGSEETFSSEVEAYILIAGGELYIDAQGDGVDANGNLYVTGGITYISGITDEKDGALDYNNEGIITGGTFVAAGKREMAQNFSESSTQASILVYADSIIDGNVELTDADKNTMIEYYPNREYSCVVISIPEIEKNGTYYINMGGTTKKVEMNGVIYSIGGTS